MCLSKIKNLCAIDKKIKIIIFNHIHFRNRTDKRPVEIGNKFEECLIILFNDNAEIIHVKEAENDDDQNMRNVNLTAQNVLKLMNEVANNGDSYSGFILFVSSHGGVRNDRNGFYETISAYDKPYRKSYLWECFFGKPGWKGKPLLFFFQACRGNDATSGARLSIDATPESKKSSINREKFLESKVSNLFIMNATQPGAVAFKCDEKKTSVFVDAIYDIFNEFSDKLDLYSMAVKICDRIARDYENCNPEYKRVPEKYDCSQQMACFESTLCTKIMMSKNECDASYETFYTSPKNPVMLLLSYTCKDNSEETARIRYETESLMNCFLFLGYLCKEAWDVDYAQYLNLIHQTFDHSERSPFFVIFNGFGERDTIKMCDEDYQLHQLWQPLLPDQTTNETYVEKPKVFIFLGKSVGVSGKFRRLSECSEDIPNVSHCNESIGNVLSTSQNIPITADLLLCFECASSQNQSITKIKQEESPFVEAFHNQLICAKELNNIDFFDVLTATNDALLSNNNEVGIFFSTLRKLLPVTPQSL